MKNNLNDFDLRQKAAKLFEAAFKANPHNPLALKYLAEHYFFQKQYNIARDLSNFGIETLKNKATEKEKTELTGFRRDISLLRSDFYFILGKVAHV